LRHRHFSYDDTAIISKGKHTLHVGFQGFRERINTLRSTSALIRVQWQFHGRKRNVCGGSGQRKPTFSSERAVHLSACVNGGDWVSAQPPFGAFARRLGEITNNLTVTWVFVTKLHTPLSKFYNRQ